MKITLFFLIVGISGCFTGGSATFITGSSTLVASKPDQHQCKLKIATDQMTGVAELVIHIVALYKEVQDSGDPCKQLAWISEIRLLLEIVACASGCPLNVILATVGLCVKDPAKRTAVVSAILNQNYNLLTQAGVTGAEAMRAAVCSMCQLMSAQGYDPIQRLQAAVINVGLVAVNTLFSLDFLGSCGFPLGFVTNTVGGVLTLTLDGVTTEVGGLLKSTGLPVSNLLDNLLGPVLTGITSGLGTSVTEVVKSLDTIFSAAPILGQLPLLDKVPLLGQLPLFGK